MDLTGKDRLPEVDPTVPTGISTALTHRREYALPCRQSEQFESTAPYGCTLEIVCGPEDNGLMMHVTLVTIETGEREYLGFHCITDDVGPDRPTEAQVRAELERTVMPASVLVVQPPGGTTLVNLATLFHTEAKPWVKGFRLLDFDVELEITPSRFRWVHGDGTEQITDWPGRAHASSLEVNETNYVSHEYPVRSDVVARVDTVWSARFRVDGGPWQPVNGTVTRTGDPVGLQVREAVPLLVDEHGTTY